MVNHSPRDCCHAGMCFHRTTSINHCLAYTCTRQLRSTGTYLTSRALDVEHVVYLQVQTSGVSAIGLCPVCMFNMFTTLNGIIIITIIVYFKSGNKAHKKQRTENRQEYTEYAYTPCEHSLTRLVLTNSLQYSKW